ncbi:MAG TPA: glycosyltransferase family 4 protein [Chitinophagaceae bacterium]|nr:glycosyltransferase family 4 protein [Chitinophagaceae bacterium]
MYLKQLIKKSWPGMYRQLQAAKKKWSSENPGAGTASGAFKPYHAKMLHAPGKDRKKVLHVIGNFWTGGSARIVIDLFEHMGHCYEQEILTRDIPPVPAYTGIDIHLCTEWENIEPVVVHLKRFNPDLIHVHFLGHHRDAWGEGDWQWYHNFFKAAATYDCPIIQNINIPTEPYTSESVNAYVYVSDYVKREFSNPLHRNLVIYPGSDFTHFSRQDDTLPDDCIGMVYRLERDKINEASIEVFIETVKNREGTRAVIVGGGNLLQHYRDRVAAEGLADSFTFTGYVAYEDLPRYYKKMSVFVAPVHRESFGQVTPFAMSMGLPVAGYRVGALPEIIADDSLLAPPGDIKKLSKVLIELLDNKERRNQVGIQNNQRAKELFSVEAMIESYKDIYGELTSKRS